MLLYSDGMKVDIDGEYQVIRKRDGWYIVGHGCCFPVRDRIDGLDLIALFEGDASCRTWN
jgi:hypothetical protein